MAGTAVGAMNLTAGSMLGPYQIEASIGAGGMGAMWKARDTRLDRTVAIKTIEGHFSERFEREAKTIASLNHPHICTLHDVGENYLVMEYIEGAPLKGPLPVSEVVRLGAQIAEALDAAHRKGITHRDLKPANVLVTKGGVKVIDFGLAKGGSPVRGEQDVTLTKPLTGEGTILGTVPYMSPEQLQGHEADARSDIFALGCVLYEMLTGKRAFEGKSQVSIMAAILEHEPAPLTEPATPAWMDRIIRRCLRKNPDDRWQSAKDIATELRDPPLPSPTAAVPARRSWLPWAIAAVASAALMLTAWNWQPRPSPGTEQALRFETFPPIGSEFRAGEFAISPDGSALAYVAITGGKRGIWIRRFAEAKPRQVSPLATSSGLSPFWSPDSRLLGYFAGGKIWRIDAMGGVPVAISVWDRNPPYGATWTENGAIFFSSGGTLYRVSALNGSPVAVLTSQQAGGFVRWPQAIGGAKLLYTLAQPQGESLYIASQAKPAERTKILDLNGNAVYAGGYLLYRRGTSLVAQKFDADRGRLEGEPRVVTESGVVDYRSGKTAMHASAGLLVASTAGSGNRLTWFDRQGKALQSLAGPAFGSFALSPDGRSIVAERRETITRGRGDLWLGSATREEWSRFTFGSDGAGYPIWSADGQAIVFRHGNPSNLARRDVNSGRVEEQLTKSPNTQWTSDWSRDGRHVLFYEAAPETHRDIWYLTLGETKPRLYLQTKINERQARFSPEPSPRWVAYESEESGQYEVYVQAFPEPRRKWMISDGGGQYALWAPGGKEILYLSASGALMSVDIQTSPDTVRVSPPRELFTAAWDAQASLPFAISPDGQRILGRVEDDSTGKPLEVIVNWQALLKEGR